MSDLWMVVGSLNREAPYFQGARGKGLTVFRFDEATGQAERMCEEAGIDNPTYLTVDPRTRCLYATSEVFGWHEGTVSAFRFDPAARRLIYLNKQPTLGSITAHASLGADGRHLFVVNYGIGPEEEGPDRALVVYPIGPGGHLAAPSGSVSHRGRGPDGARQERAHPHCVLPSPDDRFLVVADLGLDALVSYRWTGDGTLPDAASARSPLPPGAGPRHFVWHPDGHLAMVICELDSTVSSLSFDPGSSAFTLRSTVSTLPQGVTGENHCSGLQISFDGRFVYAANRGHDSIAVLALEDGTLTPHGHVTCGRTPRDLTLSPTGGTLVTADQNGDTMSVYAVDLRTGLLRAKAPISVGTPMCVKFIDDRFGAHHAAATV